MTSRCEDKKLIIVRNKADKPSDADFTFVKSQATLNDAGAQRSFNFQFSTLNFQFIELSAKFDPNIDALQHLLVQAAEMPEVTQADVIVTNVRHYEALTHALEAIQRVQQGLHDGLSGDFLSQDIRECIYHLSDIVGEATADDVLQNIFKHFCVGK